MKDKPLKWKNATKRLEIIDGQLIDVSGQELFRASDGKYYLILRRRKQVWSVTEKEAARWLILSGYDLMEDLEAHANGSSTLSDKQEQVEIKTNCRET